MAPIIGCPEKFDLPASAFAGASTAALSGYGGTSRRDKECGQHLGNVNGQYPRVIGADRLRPSSIISATFCSRFWLHSRFNRPFFPRTNPV
jgi:hypothetical protein